MTVLNYDNVDISNLGTYHKSLVTSPRISDNQLHKHRLASIMAVQFKLFTGHVSSLIVSI